MSYECAAMERMLAEILDNEGEEVLTKVVFEPSYMTGVDVGSMTRRGLLRRLQGLQMEMNKLQAEQQEAIAAFTRKATGPKVGVAKELSMGTAITPNMAENHIAVADALTTRLPETFAAMKRGDIDWLKAKAIVDPTVVLSDEQAREVDAIMAERIARKNPAALRRSVNRAVIKVDPDGYDERCAKKRAQRKLELIPQDEGMVQLSADLP